LGYALSSIGADHMQAAHDPAFSSMSPLFDKSKSLGILRPVNRLSLAPEKVRLFIYLQYWWSALNCLGICLFSTVPHSASVYETHHIEEIIKATTGWNISMWELMKAGERALNIARCFNVREGLSKDKDWLPERLFHPLQSGSRKGANISKSQFRKAVTLYYQMMGWDKDTGIPSRSKRQELGVKWIADHML
jgi:aldehyde:ferredoxin oxidoreductase